MSKELNPMLVELFCQLNICQGGGARGAYYFALRFEIRECEFRSLFPLFKAYIFRSLTLIVEEVKKNIQKVSKKIEIIVENYLTVKKSHTTCILKNKLT